MIRWSGPVIAQIDMLMSLMAAFVVQISPVQEQIRTADKPVCELAIDIQWQADAADDVDLRVIDPKHGHVSWQAPQGLYLDLIRDDRGIADGTTNNSERVCARNLPDGEYIVNVHMFSAHPAKIPMTVHTDIVRVDPGSATTTDIFKGDVTLDHPGQQLTVARFTMQDGKFVPGSLNNLPYKEW